MGVPKFFRYISERYPCLSEFVKEYQIPEFDNLYLDMNGIIHMCSHPDDNNPHFRITEEKIFSDIFHYIEILFRMIQPQKLFFMAVDGVAPRAKMNQQRGRRFRSAKDAEKAEAEAMKKGEELPEAARFDSNCITPGTPFMAKLQEQLKYFVVKKVSTDDQWKKCKVILSGHETPGEGEHKIMDYIRFIRSQPGYDPNTRHCLYGLDADLIMLGLCTHDPHFSLLREEVKFGRKSTKRNNVPEQIRFFLLHLSLMREYLELEFAPLKDRLKAAKKFEFDMEKIIDDWILMGFLVGNDFIPNLPNLHITNGALPVLYNAYMEVLPSLDGYINEGGYLNLERFEKFMMKLGDIDLKAFEEVYDDLLYMEAKTGRKHRAHAPVNEKAPGNGFINTKEMDPALASLIQSTDDLDIDSTDESSEETSSSDEAFKNYKDEYYRNKMEFHKVTPDVMRDQAEGYVRAIQWNLHYYYHGVCSWSWYYPHHYSPYISDIKGFSQLKIDFELGEPFKPYEQLLAVLPSASKILLPISYHTLMTSENSLIREYYPENFQTDLNGKRQEWEAVVLVPFIDEKKLLEAMRPCNEQLTPEEISRNTHGPMLEYHYVEEELEVYVAPSYFGKVINHAKCKLLKIEDIRVPRDKLVKGAYPGAKFDVYYPGFPTMKHLTYKGALKKAQVRVFEQASRGESMVLQIQPKESNSGTHLLGKLVWVGWPHLVEAKVVSVLSRESTWKSVENNPELKKDPTPAKLFDSMLEGVTRNYKERLGVECGPTELLAEVKLMSGRQYIITLNGRLNLEKQFSAVSAYFPIQAVVEDISAYDSHHSAFRDVQDVFSVGSTCFLLTNPHYGSKATILDSSDCLKNSPPQLKVSITVEKEPDFSSIREMEKKNRNFYQDLRTCASQVALSNYTFSRITGSLFVTLNSAGANSRGVNLGLDLKFNKKNQETPGFTKKINNVWYYSSRSVDLVRDYIDHYPEIFDYLAYSKADDLVADDIFEEEGSDSRALGFDHGYDPEESMKAVQNWLRTLPSYNAERWVCGGNALDESSIMHVQQLVNELQVQERQIIMQVRPQVLYVPELRMGNLPPDINSEMQLLDRIVCTWRNGAVPFGLKGTVTAIKRSLPCNDAEDELFDILFDEPREGLLGENRRCYTLSKKAFINLTHGRRLMEEKTGRPGALRARAREQNINYPQMPPAPNAPPYRAPPQNSAFASFSRGGPEPVRPRFQVPNFFPQPPRPPPQNFQTTPVRPALNSFMPNFNTAPPQIAPAPAQPPIPMLPPNVTGPPPPVPKIEQRVHSDTDYLRKVLGIPTDPIQAQSPPGNNPGPSQRREPRPIFKSTGGATAELLTFYQQNALGCPRYMYFEGENGIVSQIILPNGAPVVGLPAVSKENASDNVALLALEKLKSRSTFSTSSDSSRGQNSRIEPQIFINSSYKGQPKVNSAEKTRPNRQGSSQSSSNNRTRQEPSSSRTFVPLQVLKKPTNKQNLSSESNTSNNTRSDNNKGSGQSTTTDNSLRESNSQERRQGGRPRKTRIAANFVGRK